MKDQIVYCNERDRLITVKALDSVIFEALEDIGAEGEDKWRLISATDTHLNNPRIVDRERLEFIRNEIPLLVKGFELSIMRITGQRGGVI